MVTLDVEQHRRAKTEAAARGISLAEYIRQAVARELDDDAVTARADRDALVGLFDSGEADVAAHKDRYVADAVSERHAARTRA